ncbi:TATA box-binding protein-associated factor RNA polymerase I subunit C-like isoform X2 [Calliopsis andreniformis]|uniref:TATA box-binding protein-associated factor RNA polymerase I subunit C-like isoform X2 n=1 Tax=Calliopsis andreniformis TaxID=337506 RepID=UPI003FCDA2DB
MEEQSILTSKAYKRAESNLKEKLKSTFLKHYAHHLVPGYNLHSNFSVDDVDVENIVEQYQDYPYHCDLPRPFLPPARLPRMLNEEDPALELLTTKNHIKDDVQRMKHYYEKHDKDLELVCKKDVKWNHTGNSVTAKVPKYIADIAEIIDMDPDPHFEGVYNWYYTGGTLDYVQLNDMNIFLFPFMGDLVATPMVNVEEFLWRPQLQKAAKCELDGSLYELKHNVNTDTCMILGRYKNHCNFYMLSERDNKCNLTEIHRQLSKIPYVGADLSSTDTHHYCTINAGRSVTLWDITKMKYISSNTIMQTKVLDDSWGTVRFQVMDPNVILFVDRCCLHYLDVRAPFDKPALTLCPKSYLEKCENLSLDVESRHNSCRYVATCHSILMCDNRFEKQCVQQKWTHQFQGPPLMGHAINRDSMEFVILSSQIAGESTIILNTWTSSETSHSYHFPFTPPDVMKTLNESQMQGMCLNPYLRNRFELCNIGSIIIKNEANELFFFLQNSIGDVYYQCITYNTALDKYSPINCKSYCILKAWENAVSLQTDTIVPLTITDKSNMQHVYESFTNRKLRLKYSKHESDFEPSWKQSLEKLNSYMDILAPELLALWEICEEVPVPLTAAPHQKVLNWLESADTKVFIPSQEELDNITPINTQELISISQEVDITCLDDSNALQELLLPKVKTSKKKLNTRKRQKT